MGTESYDTRPQVGPWSQVPSGLSGRRISFGLGARRAIWILQNLHAGISVWRACC